MSDWDKEIFTISVRLSPYEVAEVMTKLYEQKIMKPVVHGKWVYDEHGDMFYCSECGGGAVSNVYNYCMWCGAKMYDEVSE